MFLLLNYNVLALSTRIERREVFLGWFRGGGGAKPSDVGGKKKYLIYGNPEAVVVVH